MEERQYGARIHKHDLRLGSFVAMEHAKGSLYSLRMAMMRCI